MRLPLEDAVNEPQKPREGASYRREPDGSLTVLFPATLPPDAKTQATHPSPPPRRTKRKED